MHSFGVYAHIGLPSRLHLALRSVAVQENVNLLVAALPYLPLSAFRAARTMFWVKDSANFASAEADVLAALAGTYVITSGDLRWSAGTLFTDWLVRVKQRKSCCDVSLQGETATTQRPVEHLQAHNSLGQLMQ